MGGRCDDDLSPDDDLDYEFPFVPVSRISDVVFITSLPYFL